MLCNRFTKALDSASCVPLISVAYSLQYIQSGKYPVLFEKVPSPTNRNRCRPFPLCSLSLTVKQSKESPVNPIPEIGFQSSYLYEIPAIRLKRIRFRLFKNHNHRRVTVTDFDLGSTMTVRCNSVSEIKKPTKDVFATSLPSFLEIRGVTERKENIITCQSFRRLMSNSVSDRKRGNDAIGSRFHENIDGGTTCTGSCDC